MNIGIIFVGKYITMDIQDIIAGGGMTFKKGKDESAVTPEKNGKKTKAKKSTYVKGTHGSGAAKMKAAYKKRRQTKSANKINGNKG